MEDDWQDFWTGGEEGRHRAKDLDAFNYVAAEANAKGFEINEAYRYLRGVFEVCAPQCTPFPDLIGLCTQIDNLIA